MPRKPKNDKQTITVLVDGSPVRVILHPPTAKYKSWCVYWKGLPTKKSTGQSEYSEAVRVAEAMLRNGGEPPQPKDARLTDEEFEAIQRFHFGRKIDVDARRRAEKSLEDSLDAIAAFREITGLQPVTAATPDDCARFQRTALTLPSDWRRKPLTERKPIEHYRQQAVRGPQTAEASREASTRYSPNTVEKWSRSLLAAFNRANRNAGRKCVRGVVDECKLLTSNPWEQFTWIEGTRRPKRRFDGHELLSLLAHLETEWPGVPVGAAAAKVFLWSGCRKQEVAGLTWDDRRLVGNEVHFEVVGKHAVRRWFRIPPALHEELASLRTASRFVFAAYSEQIRRVHQDNPGCLKKIRSEYDPENFADWFYRRVREWSADSPKGRAYVHHFRKTSLQHSRRGEDINRQVAADASVGESVMMASYVDEEDEELRARSNRTFRRIAASLSPEVARRYGYVETEADRLEQHLQAALTARDYPLVAELSARLARKDQPEAG